MGKFVAILCNISKIINRNKLLIVALAKRDILSKYRGSMMGIFWSLVNPILMLVVYTFVFSVVFKAKWGQGTGSSQTEFALTLFAGLMIYSLFSEVVGRSPSLIVANVNYVKKVVFPIEILSVVALLSSLFNFFISFCVWFVFLWVFYATPSWELILLPVIIFPLCLMMLGISWFLAALGVYLRDISQVVSVLLMILMYLSPIFYPVEVLPENFQAVMYASPLTFVIEQCRTIMMWGGDVDWLGFVVYTAISAIVYMLGAIWFDFTRKGFADVV